MNHKDAMNPTSIWLLESWGASSETDLEFAVGFFMSQQRRLGMQYLVA